MERLSGLDASSLSLDTPTPRMDVCTVLVLGLDHVFDGAALDVTVLSSLHQLRWGPIAGREAMPELWAPAASEPDAPAELRKAADRVAA